jgi:hypothetical protein
MDTPFFIGSISKQFCGVLALKHIPHLKPGHNNVA